jgi:integrase
MVPIYVRLKSGREIDIVCKIDVLVKPDNWSNDEQKAKQRADVHKFKYADIEEAGKRNLNDKIVGLRIAIESEVNNIHQSDLVAMLQDRDPLKKRSKKRNAILTKWLETVIDKHWHPDKYKTNLFSFIQSFIEKSKTKPNPKTGRPVSYKMRREYEVTFNYLKDYSAKSGKEFDFKDIDLNFYDGFIQYLQEAHPIKRKSSKKKNSDQSKKQNPENKKLAVNTIGKKIQTLKIFLNAAKEEGKNSYDAYKSKKFVAMSEESETIYLNESELTTLFNKDLSKNTAQERVRDLFLVGCWTGCRFSDIAQITPESISEGLISLKQYKTGKRVLIPLHPVVTAILNKYEGRLPEAISNQKFNKSLKEIAKDAGINEMTHKAITKGGVKVSTAYKKHELVTTHTARRSFATNLYKSGFPSISIMAITGHTTEKSFLKYIKVTPDEHAKKLQLHWDNRHLKVV